MFIHVKTLKQRIVTLRLLRNNYELSPTYFKNNMEVFSEGVIICKSLFVDQSRQYCYEKNYMRLSDARYQHSSSKLYIFNVNQT